jgi:hypothetical protein
LVGVVVTTMMMMMVVLFVLCLALALVWCVAAPCWTGVLAGSLGGGVMSALHSSEGVYVSVYGHLRTFAGTRSIVGYRIIVVEDFNQITYHNLHAIQVHLYHTKGAPPAAAADNTMATASSSSAYTGGLYPPSE